jgi:hypothetical protein
VAAEHARGRLLSERLVGALGVTRRAGVACAVLPLVRTRQLGLLLLTCSAHPAAVCSVTCHTPIPKSAARRPPGTTVAVHTQACKVKVECTFLGTRKTAHAPLPQRPLRCGLKPSATRGATGVLLAPDGAHVAGFAGARARSPPLPTQLSSRRWLLEHLYGLGRARQGDRAGVRHVHFVHTMSHCAGHFSRRRHSAESPAESPSSPRRCASSTSSAENSQSCAWRGGMPSRGAFQWSSALFGTPAGRSTPKAAVGPPGTHACGWAAPAGSTNTGNEHGERGRVWVVTTAAWAWVCPLPRARLARGTT